LHIENNFETELAANLYAKDARILEYAVDRYYLLLEHQEG